MKKPLLVPAIASIVMMWAFGAGTSAAFSHPLAAAQASESQPAAQSFTGTVVKSGDTFKLNDVDSKMSYTLDDTQRASQYEGKKAKVTGTLDAQTHTIHVRSIEAASSTLDRPAH